MNFGRHYFRSFNAILYYHRGKGALPKNYPNYIEVENLSSLEMNNFKQGIVKPNVYQRLKTDPDANLNNNYKILSAVIMESKANHLP